MTRRQCKTCPWKVGASVDAIPDYVPALHHALADTIAEPGSLRGLGSRSLRVMACHYSTADNEVPCVGWVAHQLGPGNNLALRLQAAFDPSFGDVQTEGPQHECFEDTLPRKGVSRRRRAR